MTVNSASTENSRKMISTPKNTPVIGALNVAEMPPAAPQATRIRSRFSGIFTPWPKLEASAGTWVTTTLGIRQFMLFGGDIPAKP